MLNLFKKKEKQIDTELENVKMVALPDIRAYMLKGYEEIRNVKSKNEQLEQKIKELQDKADKNEQLYNAQLVVSQEFESRCRKLEKDIDFEKSKRIDENTKLQADIDLNLKRIDKLKEEKYILEEKLNNLETYQSEKIKQNMKEYSKELISQIKNIKGRLSKEIVIDLISKNL